MEILDFSNNLKVNKFALVIGIGGAGGNVLSYIYKKHKSNDIVDFLALNTDMQALSALEIPLLSKFLIGESITRGNGAGADPEKGQLSAVESSKFIQNILKLHLLSQEWVGELAQELPLLLQKFAKK